MHRKHFTLEEARAHLPKVEKLLKQLLALRHKLTMLDAVDIQYDDPDVANAYEVSFNREFHRLAFKFYDCLNTLERSGCIVKDLDTGLVDFPSFVDGREIYLCWHLGEEDVYCYHELDSGFSGRKSVFELDNKAFKQ